MQDTDWRLDTGYADIGYVDIGCWILEIGIWSLAAFPFPHLSHLSMMVLYG